VGVGFALILVIAVAVAAFVWRKHVLDRRRTPEERCALVGYRYSPPMPEI
jgi:hypothetical protein